MSGEADPEVGGGESCELADQVVTRPELSSHITEAGLVFFPAAGEVELATAWEGSSVLEDRPAPPVCGLVTQPGRLRGLEQVEATPAVGIFLLLLPAVGGV